MSYLSHLHEDLRRVRLTKRGATHRAEDVARGEHKEYPRMERLPLPPPSSLSTSLEAALQKRASSLRESGTVPLSLAEISTLLGHGLGKRPDHMSRNYPSGGALYPIETYLIAASIEGGAPGVYHYHPSAHALERLWELPSDFNMRALISRPDFLSPSLVLIFTSVWARSSAKYGDFTYPLALLEAGHMSENVLLAAAALDLETRPMAGFDDQIVADLLDLDTDFEQPVHSITFSKGSKSIPHQNAED